MALRLGMSLERRAHGHEACGADCPRPARSRTGSRDNHDNRATHPLEISEGRRQSPLRFRNFDYPHALYGTKLVNAKDTRQSAETRGTSLPPELSRPKRRSSSVLLEVPNGLARMRPHMPLRSRTSLDPGVLEGSDHRELHA